MILGSGRTIDLSESSIMGIVNVTPDSFFPGSRVSDQPGAIEKALEMLDDGAVIVDIGGESSRPGALEIDWKEEVNRVIPVVRGIREQRPEAVISVDTRNWQTAELALEAGADIINDITGLRDPEMAAVVASFEAGAVLMHMRGTPETMRELTDYRNVVEQVRESLVAAADRAIRFGINEERIILDPGIGFAKNAEQSIELLREISVLKETGFPLLVGHSRKSFIGHVSGLPVEKRLEETLAISSFLYLKGVDILRVHDVSEHRRIFDILKVLCKPTSK